MTKDLNTDTLSQFDRQLEILCSYNLQVPCNPQGEFAASGFKILLQSLSSTKISDSLRGSYQVQSLGMTW